jgi:hypothetical protein
MYSYFFPNISFDCQHWQDANAIGHGNGETITTLTCRKFDCIFRLFKEII